MNHDQQLEMIIRQASRTGQASDPEKTLRLAFPAAKTLLPGEVSLLLAEEEGDERLLADLIAARIADISETTITWKLPAVRDGRLLALLALSKGQRMTALQAARNDVAMTDLRWVVQAALGDWREILADPVGKAERLVQLLRTFSEGGLGDPWLDEVTSTEPEFSDRWSDSDQMVVVSYENPEKTTVVGVELRYTPLGLPPSTREEHELLSRSFPLPRELGEALRDIRPR